LLISSSILIALQLKSLSLKQKVAIEGLGWLIGSDGFNIREALDLEGARDADLRGAIA